MPEGVIYGPPCRSFRASLQLSLYNVVSIVSLVEQINICTFGGAENGTSKQGWKTREWKRGNRMHGWKTRDAILITLYYQRNMLI